MINKKILLSALPLLAVAILSLNLLGGSVAASAIPGQEIGAEDQIKIQGKGTGTCTGISNITGESKANVRFILLVEESINGNYKGVAKVDIKKMKSTCDGMPKNFKNNDPLQFSYIANSNEMTISGIMKTKHDALYNLHATGSYQEASNGSTTMDMTLQGIGLENTFGLDLAEMDVSFREGCKECTSIEPTR